MTTKIAIMSKIIMDYRHDYEAEGSAISKRRLWYILKPAFFRLPSYEVAEVRLLTQVKKNPTFKKQIKAMLADGTITKADLKDDTKTVTVMVKYMKDVLHNGKPVQMPTNADYNKHFNTLADDGLIDDTFIMDNSRTMNVGSCLPKIIICAEKSTIDTSAIRLARDLGVSVYMARGFSSIYAAKKLLNEVEASLNFEPYDITDEILNDEHSFFDPYRKYDSEAKDSDIIVLNLTDLDKSGEHISDTIANHFGADEHHRVLLEASQIPEDKIGDYFNIREDGTKDYELDILNIHQLREIFLDNIPEHIANMILEKNVLDYNMVHRDREVPRAINKDDAVVAIDDVINTLQEEKDSLEEEYREQIEEIEKAMADATMNVDSLIETEEEKRADMQRELFPQYKEKYDQKQVVTLKKKANIVDFANDHEIPTKYDREWTQRVL